MVIDYLAQHLSAPLIGYTGSQTHQQHLTAYRLGTDGAYHDQNGNIQFANNDGTAWYGWDNVPASFPYPSGYPVEDVINWRIYRATGNIYYVAVALPASPTQAQQDTFKQNLVSDIDNGYPEADNQWSASGYELPWQPSGFTEHYAQTEGGAQTVVVALGGHGYIW